MKKLLDQQHFDLGTILSYRLRSIAVLHVCAVIALSNFDINLKAMEEDKPTLCNLSTVAVNDVEAPEKTDWNNLPAEVKLHIVLFLTEKVKKFKEFFDYSLVSRDFASYIDACPLSIIKTYKFSDQKKITITDILFKAVKTGCVKIIEMLIERGRGMDVNAIDGYGRNTPLILAAENGHTEIVQLLLECYANIEDQNMSESTPLILAAENGHAEIVQLLIECYANSEAQDKDGFTPLMVAARDGHTEIVKWLIEEEEANIEVQNNDGLTPLILAAKNGHTEIVQLLIDNGADIEDQDRFQSTSLMLAAENGHTETVQVLLENGANIEAQDGSFTALTLAAKNGHTKIVKLLIKNKADVNIRSAIGATALMVATRHGHAEIVKLLNASGANN